MNKNLCNVNVKYVVIVDYFDSWSFFNRLLKDIPKDKIVVVTNLLSIKKTLKKSGITCTVIKRFPLTDQLPLETLNATREVASKDITLNSALVYYSAIYKSIEDICLASRFKIKILTWNGTDIKGAAMRDIESKYSAQVSCIFYEITNFPNFVFADKKGVNATSSAYITPEIYQNTTLAYKPVHYEKLIKKLIQSKNNPVIPQTKLSKKLDIRHFLDYIYCASFGVSNFSIFATFKKLKNKLTSRKATVIPKSLLLSELSDTIEFAFFPMQVSSDSQLLINYSGGVMDSLREAYEISTTKNFTLYIKLHPAENNANITKEIINFCKKNGLKILDIDVNQILQKSKFVITVNSTIGFECLLIDREVIFIGVSQYEQIKTRDHLYKYLNYYFYETDFFATESMDLKIKNNLLNV